MFSSEDLAALKQQLVPEEARRGDVYDDATGHTIRQGSTVIGHPTIGVGHNLDAAPMGDRAIEAQLEDDVQAKVNDVLRALPWASGLDGPRWRVLVDLAFNAGVGGLLAFHRMLAAVQKGDYPTAAAELLNSTLAPSRKRYLAALMRSPV